MAIPAPPFLRREQSDRLEIPKLDCSNPSFVWHLIKETLGGRVSWTYHKWSWLGLCHRELKATVSYCDRLVLVEMDTRRGTFPFYFSRLDRRLSLRDAQRGWMTIEYMSFEYEHFKIKCLIRLLSLPAKLRAHRY